ncbi:MAG: fimbrillin family protein [Rikenellaceae bacterium]
MKKIYFVLLCIGATLVSCSKDGANTTAGDAVNYVKINPMIQTRATDLDFESGDMVGITIEMESDNSLFTENAPLTYSGSSFTSDLIWYSDIDATSTIYAYYPYAAGSSAPTSFTVEADQTADGAYTASDLMGSTKSGVTPDYTVVMTFNHLLSRIVTEIDNQSVYKVESVEISGSYPTATFDATAMSVEVDESSTPISISAPLWDDETYKAIIIPQTAALTFTITFNDGSVISREKASVDFAAGKEYTANITIVGGDVTVDLSGDANEWADGGTIPDPAAKVIYFAEYDDYFEYGYEGEFVTYDIVTFSNGSTWMAEPLAFLPEGYTPSADATVESNIWYPYEIDYDQMVTDEVTTATLDYVNVLTDQASIEAKGYLYNMTAALGQKVTEDNFDTFEGAQGICPDGWHIPTRADYFALVGYSNKSLSETSAPTDSSAIFYDTAYNGGKIATLNEAGFNYVYTGYRNYAGYLSTTDPSYSRTIISSSNSSLDEEFYGEPALSYYMTSTAYQVSYNSTSGLLSNIQFFGLMSTFTSAAYPEGRLMLAYVSENSGTALRCVKDSATLE